MRNNYFRKLMNYIKNVYNIERYLYKMKDSRINPTYCSGHVILTVLFGFLLRIRSFNELNCMLKENEFARLLPTGTKLPMIDAIRDTLKVTDLNCLSKMNRHILRKAIGNKVFDNGTIDGYTVAAIDGTKFFGSYLKQCSNCLSTIIKGKDYFYHSGVVMSIVGDAPKLVLDFEMYDPKIDSTNKDEGEQSAAMRMLSRVIANRKQLLDVVVYDALVCNSVWINSCLDYGIDTVVRMKNNNNKSLKQVKTLANKSEPEAVWNDEKGISEVTVYEKTFIMAGVEQPMRFVKFALKYADHKRSQIMIVTNNFEMSLKTIFRIIRARCDIEDCIFNNMKQGAGLEHCFVHGGNAVEAVLWLIFIAGNLFQLFKLRRMKNHIPIQKELVRLLLKGLYLLKYDRKLIIDTG